jgi:hypothetical protein
MPQYTADEFLDLCEQEYQPERALEPPAGARDMSAERGSATERAVERHKAELHRKVSAFVLSVIPPYLL